MHAPTRQADGSPSNGEAARELLKRHGKRVVSLQKDVLADRDPEPLHQMRVGMRRLRTAVVQFAPALALPESVNDRRIARIGRRLGMARDLDVLRHRLEMVLMPQLPDSESKALKPVLKQLRRERGQAYEQLAGTLNSGSYLEMLADLQGWVKEPKFTALGQEPLEHWLIDWQAPLLAGVFLHPGWFVSDLSGDLTVVHDLRKQLKAVRYRMENLREWAGPRCSGWVERFERLQELLGELNDLQVLQKAIDGQLPGRMPVVLPQLDWLLQENERQCWREWRGLAEGMQQPHRRRSLLQALMIEESGGRLPPWWRGWLWRLLDRST